MCKVLEGRGRHVQATDNLVLSEYRRRGGRGKAGRLGSELPALWRLNEMCYKSFSFSKATGKPMHGCR